MGDALQSDALQAIAARHGFSADAANTAVDALRRGGGTMAQFHHPELGGAGQWMPGMLMIGDMFNGALKGRVDGLISEIAAALSDGRLPSSAEPAFAQPAGPSVPAFYGQPAATGSQNDFAYAFYPAAGRLVIQQHGRRRSYATGPHHIGGVSQQQSGVSQSALFTSQLGHVTPHELPEVTHELG